MSAEDLALELENKVGEFEGGRSYKQKRVNFSLNNLIFFLDYSYAQEALKDLVAFLGQNKKAREIVRNNEEDQFTWNYGISLGIQLLEGALKSKSKADSNTRTESWDAFCKLLEIAELEGSFMSSNMLTNINGLVSRVLKDSHNRNPLGQYVGKIVKILLLSDKYNKTKEVLNLYESYFDIFSRPLITMVKKSSKTLKGTVSGSDGKFMQNAPNYCADILLLIMNSDPRNRMQFLEEKVFPFYREYLQAGPGHTSTTQRLFQGLNSVLRKHVMTAVGPFRIFADYMMQYCIKSWGSRRQSTVVRGEIIKFLKITVRVNSILPAEDQLQSFSSKSIIQTLVGIFYAEIVSAKDGVYIDAKIESNLTNREGFYGATLNEATYNFLYIATYIISIARENVFDQPYNDDELDDENKKYSDFDGYNKSTRNPIRSFCVGVMKQDTEVVLQFLCVLMAQFPSTFKRMFGSRDKSTTKASFTQLLEKLLRVLQKGANSVKLWGLICLCYFTDVVSNKTKQWQIVWRISKRILSYGNRDCRRMALYLLKKIIQKGLVCKKMVIDDCSSLIRENSLLEYESVILQDSISFDTKPTKRKRRKVRLSTMTSSSNSGEIKSNYVRGARRKPMRRNIMVNQEEQQEEKTVSAIDAVAAQFYMVVMSKIPIYYEVKTLSIIDKCIAKIPNSVGPSTIFSWSSIVCRLLFSITHLENEDDAELRRKGKDYDATYADENIGINLVKGHYLRGLREQLRCDFDSSSTYPSSTPMLQFAKLVDCCKDLRRQQHQQQQHVLKCSSLLSFSSPSSSSSHIPLVPTMVAESLQNRMLSALQSAVNNATTQTQSWTNDRNKDYSRRKDIIPVLQELSLNILHWLHIIAKSLKYRHKFQRVDESTDCLLGTFESLLRALSNTIHMLLQLKSFPPVGFTIFLEELLIKYHSVFSYSLRGMGSSLESDTVAVATKRIGKAFLQTMKFTIKLFEESIRNAKKTNIGRASKFEDEFKVDFEEDGVADKFMDDFAQDDIGTYHERWERTKGYLNLLCLFSKDFRVRLPSTDSDQKRLDDIMERSEIELRQHGMFFKMELLILLNEDRNKHATQLCKILEDVEMDIQENQFDLIQILQFFLDVFKSVISGSLKLEEKKDLESRRGISQVKARCKAVFDEITKLWNHDEITISPEEKLLILRCIIPGIRSGLLNIQHMLLSSTKDENYSIRLFCSRECAKLLTLFKNGRKIFDTFRKQIRGQLENLALPRDESFARSLMATLCQFALRIPSVRSLVLLDLCYFAGTQPQLYPVCQLAYVQLCKAVHHMEDTCISENNKQSHNQDKLSSSSDHDERYRNVTASSLLRVHMEYVITEWFALGCTFRDFPFQLLDSYSGKATSYSFTQKHQRPSESIAHHLNNFEKQLSCAAVLSYKSHHGVLVEIASILNTSVAKILRRHFAGIFARVHSMYFPRDELDEEKNNSLYDRAKATMEYFKRQIGEDVYNRMYRKQDDLIMSIMELVTVEGTRTLPQCRIEDLLDMLTNIAENMQPAIPLAKLLCRKESDRIQMVFHRFQLWFDSPSFNNRQKWSLYQLLRKILLEVLDEEIQKPAILRPALHLVLWLIPRFDEYAEQSRSNVSSSSSSSSSSKANGGLGGKTSGGTVYSTLQLLRDFCGKVMKLNPQSLSKHLQDIVTALVLYYRRAEATFHDGRLMIEKVKRRGGILEDFDGNGKVRQRDRELFQGRTKGIASLLDLIIGKAYKEHPRFFVEPIRSLTPMPKIPLFAFANRVCNHLCKKDNLSQKIKRFIANVSRSHSWFSSSHHVPGASHLLDLLRMSRQEMLVMMESRNEAEVIAELQQVLVGLCAEENGSCEEVRQLAGLCLGEIGILLHGGETASARRNANIVESDDGDQESDQSESLLETSHLRIVLWLHQFLRDSDAKIVLIAAETLREILSEDEDTLAWSQLPSSVRNNLNPYRSKALRRKEAKSRRGNKSTDVAASSLSCLQQTTAALGRNVTGHEVEDLLWDPRGKSSAKWVTNITAALATRARDPIYRYTSRMCLAKPEFASFMLPRLVFDVMCSSHEMMHQQSHHCIPADADNKGVISGKDNDSEFSDSFCCTNQINVQLQRFVNGRNNDGSGDQIDEAVMDDIFRVLHYVRKKHINIMKETHLSRRKESKALREILGKHEDKLDKLVAVEAACYLQMHFSALIFLEAFYKEQHVSDQPTGEMKQAIDFMGHSSSNSFLEILKKNVGDSCPTGVPSISRKQTMKESSKNVARVEVSSREGGICRRFLTKIFRASDDPDAIYGVPAVSSDIETELLLTEHEEKWPKVLQIYDGMCQEQEEQQRTSEYDGKVNKFQHSSPPSQASSCSEIRSPSKVISISGKKRTRSSSTGNETGIHMSSQRGSIANSDQAAVAEKGGLLSMSSPSLDGISSSTDVKPFRYQMQLQRGLTDSLHRMGYCYLLQRYMEHISKTNTSIYEELADSHYEVAWKSSNWSLEQSNGSSSTVLPPSTFHVSLYRALVGLKDSNLRLVDSNIMLARSEILGTISRIGKRAESFAIVMPSIVQLQLLHDIQESRDLIFIKQRQEEQKYHFSKGDSASTQDLEALYHHSFRTNNNNSSFLSSSSSSSSSSNSLVDFQEMYSKRIRRYHGKFQLIEPVLNLRSVLLEIAGNHNLLGNHLHEASKLAREARVPHTCQTFLQRATRHPELNFIHRMKILLEEAHLLWDAKDEQRAISHAMHLVRKLRSCNQEVFRDISPREIVRYQVDLHCLLGEWLSETLSEGTETINRILDSAKQPVLTTTTAAAAALVKRHSKKMRTSKHHDNKNGMDEDTTITRTSPTGKELHKVNYQMGKFHDRMHQRLIAQKKSVEYQRSHKLMRENMTKFKTLQDGLKQQDEAKKGGSGGSRRKHLVYTKAELRSHMNILQKNIDMDRKKHEALEENIQISLVKAIRCYGQCLVQGDEYDRSVLYRLISLWFSNSNNEQVSRQMGYAIRNIPIYKFMPLVYQIASRLKVWNGAPNHQQSPASSSKAVQSSSEMLFRSTVYTLVKKMAIKYPFHTLYQIFALENGDKLHKQSRLSKGFQIDVERKNAAKIMLTELKSSTAQSKTVNAIGHLIEAFIDLSNKRFPQSNERRRKVLALRSIPLSKLSNEMLELLPVPTSTLEVRPDGDYSQAPKISHFGKTVKFANTGISRPMIIECTNTDGQSSRLLAKPKDDLRQDAVMEQVFRLVNDLLYENVHTRRRRLRMRTYNVVPFTPCVGLVEWVENTTSIGDYLTKPQTGAHIRYARPDQKWVNAHDIQKYLLYDGSNGRNKKGSGTGKKKKSLFEKYREISRDFQPVFRHFFHENFSDPCAWFHRRTEYTRSVAVSSIVGYVVGLGDRHCQNILIDKHSAEFVQIDLGVAFDQGRILKTPEIVPFRLTRDIVDGMGITGVEGIFRRCCEETMRVLRSRKEMLLTVLEVFVHDPLYRWALSPEKLDRLRPKDYISRLPSAGVESKEERAKNSDAERALFGIKQKLQGTEFERTLSVEGQIKTLINEATDPKNLSKMFVGWAAWV